MECIYSNLYIIYRFALRVVLGILSTAAHLSSTSSLASYENNQPPTPNLRQTRGSSPSFKPSGKGPLAPAIHLRSTSSKARIFASRSCCSTPSSRWLRSCWIDPRFTTVSVLSFRHSSYTASAFFLSSSEFDVSRARHSPRTAASSNVIPAPLARYGSVACAESPRRTKVWLGCTHVSSGLRMHKRQRRTDGQRARSFPMLYSVNAFCLSVF